MPALPRRPLRLALTVALLAAAPALAAPPAGIPAPIASALADVKRPEADRARDGDRKAAAILAFTGLKAGQTAMDILPGGGYFTRLFSDLVGPGGRVIAYIPAEMAKPDSVAKLTAAMTAEGRTNVMVLSDPLLSPAPPEAKDAVDVAWTSQNYHDLHNLPGVDVVAYNRLIYGVVKPGGLYIVLDHAAPAGSGLSATGTTHRIDPAVVRREVEAAGFRFAGTSTVLANPADPKTAKVFDPAIRGHTDQFVYKFVKPKR